MRPIFEREGIVIEDEGIGGSVTFRNFKAPWRRYGYRRNWFTGSVVVTKLRFAAFQFSKPLINVPVDGVSLSKLKCSDENGKLRVDFEAADFMQDASGAIECRFATEHTDRLLSCLSRSTRDSL